MQLSTSRKANFSGYKFVSKVSSRFEFIIFRVGKSLRYAGSDNV